MFSAKQYKGIKKRYPSHLLFWRTDTHYFVYDECADTILQEIVIDVVRIDPFGLGKRMSIEFRGGLVDEVIATLVRRGHKCLIVEPMLKSAEIEEPQMTLFA